MSFIPRGTLYQADPSFTPLFRLLDEFDTYSREAQSNGSERPRQRGGRSNAAASYTPKFDGRETADAYELHGEFPGIDRDKINIEFMDAQTLVIRGRTEHSYSSDNTSSAGLVEGGAQSGGGAITEKGNEPAAAAPRDSSPGNGSNTTGHDKTKANKPSSPLKYWIQERTVGEFARTFHFPGPVDLSAVSARLEDGVLSLVVPKAKKSEVCRITIN